MIHRDKHWSFLSSTASLHRVLSEKEHNRLKSLRLLLCYPETVKLFLIVKFFQSGQLDDHEKIM